MKIPIFPQSILVDLYSKINANYNGYMNGFDEDFFKRFNVQTVINTEIASDFSDELIFDDNISRGNLDALNAIIIYNGLKDLTPYHAKDSRIWSALNHMFFREYTIYRHIKRPNITSKEEKLKVIGKRFFSKTSRQIDSENVSSRLWWSAYVADQCRGDHDFEKLVKTLCNNTDLRNSILERPTIFQIPQVVLASLLLHEKYPMKREVYRDWIKLINFGGGKHIYGAMSADELLKLFEQYYDEVKS